MTSHGLRQRRGGALRTIRGADWLRAGLPWMAPGAAILPLLEDALRLRWTAQALAAGLIVLLRLRQVLRQHPLPAGASLGLANFVTLWRGGLVALAAGFIGLRPAAGGVPAAMVAWMPGCLYLAAALLDRLDGWIARRLRRESDLGACLDGEFDALGLACAAMLLVDRGRAPNAYLLVGAAYYLWQGARALRLRRGGSLVVVRPWNGARLLAGCQMGFAAAALLPICGNAATRAAAWLFMPPFLAGLLRDASINLGLLDTDTDQRTRAERLLWPLLQGWGLPALRALLLPLAWLQPGGVPPYGWLLLGCAAAGVLCRLSAGVFGVLWALEVGAVPLSAPAAALLLVSLALLLAGGGRWSLWNPGQRWLQRPAGGSAAAASRERVP
jgi:CDP-diacylglycerol--glycerol-3-phosphate 3-phosphatidyltransferase